MSESYPASVRGTAVGAAYTIGRIGATLSPLLIGTISSTYSIGLGIALLGISYGLCALIPGLFIPEKLFDPQGVQHDGSRGRFGNILHSDRASVAR
jgi:AAHS family cis,cis-muconate transporter-like MFS transporter